MPAYRSRILAASLGVALLWVTARTDAATGTPPHAPLRRDPALASPVVFLGGLLVANVLTAMAIGDLPVPLPRGLFAGALLPSGGGKGYLDIGGAWTLPLGPPTRRRLGIALHAVQPSLELKPEVGALGAHLAYRSGLARWLAFEVGAGPNLWVRNPGDGIGGGLSLSTGLAIRPSPGLEMGARWASYGVAGRNIEGVSLTLCRRFGETR